MNEFLSLFKDPVFDKTVAIALEKGGISTSLLQRALHIGYGKSVAILDAMEAIGLIGKGAGGSQLRPLLLTKDEYLKRMASALLGECELDEESEPHILLLLADGFEEVEALATVDILRRGGVKIKTVGITGKQVCGSHKILVEADLTADEIAGSDPIRMLILPGGLPGADHLYQSAAVATMIRQTVAGGGHLAAICAAPYILGLHGLLEGKRATVYPADTFRERMSGALLTDAGVVTDGGVTTASAMAYAIPFALELLRLLKGEEKAKEIAASFLYSAD